MLWSPLELSIHIRDYAFGERLIEERLHKPDLPQGRISETWEISDHRDAPARIVRGPLAGQTLNEAITQYPNEIVGEGFTGSRFPLLAKFLDASHMLPVHVHADDITASQKYGEPNGKTEAWHIIWAEPGASILAGVKHGISEEELIAAFKHQDYDSVMYRHPISAGDTVYVPGGVLHSFGPGTLIYEIQQTSDLGVTVMPADLYGNPYSPTEWDRNIMSVIDELDSMYLPKPNPGLPIRIGQTVRTIGCASKHFALERWKIVDPVTIESNGSHAWLVSNCGEREISLVWRDFNTGLKLGRGKSALIPAAMESWSALPYFGSGDMIVSYVPDLEDDIVEPLREAGYTDEQIAALGEVFQADGSVAG
jgi:mannose-6-phosphate isomerase